MRSADFRFFTPLRQKIAGLIVLFASTAGFVACGGGGGSATPNDPEPGGTVIDSGQWLSQNGQSVSGTVLIYTSSTGVYTFRLSGISAPNESGLQLYAYETSGTRHSLGALRASSGNQNYTVSTGLTNWSRLDLYSAPNALNYGQVLF